MRRAIILFFAALVYSGASLGGENIPGLQGGYQDGFYLKTEDGRYLLKVGSRVDFGYTYGFVSPDTDFSSFDLYRAKIYAGGNVLSPRVQFYFQAAAASTSRRASFAPEAGAEDGSFLLEDYFIRLYHGTWGLKMGQFKLPFGRQAMTSSGNMAFVERSVTSRYFLLGRDLGLAVTSDHENYVMSAGVFNGGGNPVDFGGLGSPVFTGANSTNDTAGGGAGHLYAVRLQAMPAGACGFSEGNVVPTEGTRWELGAGFVFDNGRDVDLTNDGVRDADANVYSTSGEFVWKSGSLSFQGEFFWRAVDADAAEAVDQIGFYVQPAFVILPGRMELAGRYGWVNAGLGAGQDVLQEAAGALNLYFSRDHRYKTQLQYTWRGEDSPAGRNDDSFIDWMLQLTI